MNLAEQRIRAATTGTNLLPSVDTHTHKGCISVYIYIHKYSLPLSAFDQSKSRVWIFSLLTHFSLKGNSTVWGPLASL